MLMPKNNGTGCPVPLKKRTKFLDCLWSNAARPIDEFAAANHKLAAEVVVLADVLEQFLVGSPADRRGLGPGCCVRHRIIDRVFIGHRRHAGPCEPFGEAHALGMRRAGSIQPELLAEAYGVDNQRVAFLFADGMPVAAGCDLLGMF